MNTSPNPDPKQQLLTDISAIVHEVEQRTGLKSRWNGTLNISSNPIYLGAKHWNCDIDIDQSLLLRPRRYSTGLHEVLHSVSTGLNQADYPLFFGYEEGVVEQCTRLLRTEIFVVLGFQGPFDVRNSYPNELAALETLRSRANQAERIFYLDLLKTPLRDRDATVLQWIQQAEPFKSMTQINQETDPVRRRLKI